MTRAVIAALDASWESELVAAVEGTAGYTVARRCADLADLLAAAAAGHGDIALVSADLRALDRTALHELATHGVEAVGVVGVGDEPGERRLRQLGLDVILRADLASHEIDDALDSLEAIRSRGPQAGPAPAGAEAGDDASAAAAPRHRHRGLGADRCPRSQHRRAQPGRRARPPAADPVGRPRHLRRVHRAGPRAPRRGAGRRGGSPRRRPGRPSTCRAWPGWPRR